MLCNLPLGPNSHRQFSCAVIITILIPLCGESYFIISFIPLHRFDQVTIPLLQMREWKLKMVKILPTTQMVEMIQTQFYLALNLNLVTTCILLCAVRPNRTAFHQSIPADNAAQHPDDRNSLFHLGNWIQCLRVLHFFTLNLTIIIVKPRGTFKPRSEEQCVVSGGREEKELLSS